VAAHLAELSVDEFKALNPQFKRPVITGDEQTKILLPKENAEKFHLNLAQWTKELSTWTTHKITSARESIGSLASRFHTSPEVIRQANNIPQKSVLKAGSTILVPKISASVSATSPRKWPTTPPWPTKRNAAGRQRPRPRARGQAKVALVRRVPRDRKIKSHRRSIDRCTVVAVAARPTIWS
jgi:membrane-bound lytic murein transglycosylase D